MFGKQFSQPPPFGTVHPDDDNDIQVQRPKDAARKHLWQESRLLIRDLIFALMVLALVYFGLITYRFMARTRPYAIVLIFILAAIIAPTPDLLTLFAMASPMALLYEGCIWIAWLMERRKSRRPA